MIDHVLGHYRILSKLGEGGMRAVYRARDEVLQRDGAIKVVSEHSTADTTATEFLLHEARASAALNHPNICTVHEVEIGGELYRHSLLGRAGDTAIRRLGHSHSSRHRRRIDID